MRNRKPELDAIREALLDPYKLYQHGEIGLGLLDEIEEMLDYLETGEAEQKERDNG